MNGKNLRLFAEGRIIAMEKDCQVSIECDTLEVSSPLTGVWKAFVAGMREWSISAGFVFTIDTMGDLNAIVGQEIGVSFAFTEAPAGLDPSQFTEDGEALYGRAIVKSVQISSRNGSTVTYSVKLQGTGPLGYSDNFLYFVPQGSAGLLSSLGQDIVVPRYS